MKFNNIIIIKKNLYIFFLLGSLIIFFFSTTKSNAKAFEVDNIEISKPFEMDFDKNHIIDLGFKKGFSELISLIVNSEDQKKINLVKLNEIKGMIESFSIKEEKFINEIYYVKLGVLFNKKKVFNFLEKKNIFPSIPNKKKFLFIPILIDENKKDLLIFSNNKVFDYWKNFEEKNHLIEYILPEEDLEDLELIKKRYNTIEEYNFNEITNKYNLDTFIVALIFKNRKQVRILSRISVDNNVVLRNLSYEDIDLSDSENLEKLITDLKIYYEDYWKFLNQINTSIKLPLNIKVSNLNEKKIDGFEKLLGKTDLIYRYSINKIDKDFIYYQIIFNSTPSNFLKIMKNNNYSFNTQNKVWILK